MTDSSKAPSGHEKSEQRPMNRRQFLQGAGVGLAFAGIQYWQGRSAARGAAPPLHAIPLDPETATPFGAGPGIIHFWATWCGVCHAMRSNVEDYDGPIWRVASRSGSPEEVRAWLASEELSTRNIWVDEGESARAFGVNAFPSTFFVNADGIITDASVGYTTSAGLWLRSRFL